jgi:3-carboxy-cis,cis-muconate cycloisomerase
MTDLFWPGDHRAGDVFSDAAFLEAMVVVENAWLGVLVEAGVAPAAARADLTALVSRDDAEKVAVDAERDGNPVKVLIGLLRERGDEQSSRWLHRGLTSQDVIDSALMLCLRDALVALRGDLMAQVRTLAGLAETYHGAPMLARTLTQPALPSTVGMRIAQWLNGVLDAAAIVEALPPLPVQAGGAAGTLAATTELTGSAVDAVAMSAALAAALGLEAAMPWHTTRSVITRSGDALVTCCDAWGHIAADVLTGSRIGEFTEGSGGGSSTMPHKNNPVLSVLIRRAALTAPPLAASLHAASAASVDERSDGAWHAEWATLRTLVRRTAVAGSQTKDLLTGLVIDSDHAAENLAAAPDVLAEQRGMAGLSGRSPLSDYSGAAGHVVDAALQRARKHLKEST